MTWDAARAACQGQSQINGDLASVPDEATNEFLKSLGIGFIGGHLDSNGDWAWSDGTPWGYTSWKPDNPSNNGAIKLENIGWNDIQPHNSKKYICQHQDVKTASSEILYHL